MKILVISHEYPPVGGGGANACMFLTKEFARMGHKVDIVTIWFKSLPEKECIEEETGSVTIYRVKAKRRDRTNSSLTEMCDFVIRAIRVSNHFVKDAFKQGESYDICLIFFGIPSGIIGKYLKRKYRLPYVIRFGGGDIPGFQDRFRGVYKLIAPLIRQIWENADALVANSKGLKNMALDFCDRYPIEVIHNGVDTELYSPLPDRNKQQSKDEVVLLFVSRLIERKGLQYIIPNMNSISEKSKKNIRLLIAGNGPYKEKLEKLAHENGTERFIQYEGEKGKEELPEFYRKGDIFVFPSKKEGMPNAVLEAMSCGLPIVMSPCQGSEELIDGNGVISSPDLGHFNESILQILSLNEEERIRLGEKSRERALKLFSWRVSAKKYINIFEGCCKGIM